jgi:hypothetical protein
LDPKLILIIGSVTKNPLFLEKIRENLIHKSSDFSPSVLKLMSSDDNKYGLIGALINFARQNKNIM